MLKIKHGIAVVVFCALAGWLMGTEEKKLSLWPPFEMGGMTFRQVEVAKTPAERSRGLMYRTYLPQDGGMLFLCDEPDVQVFWMKNTKIALDVIYLDAAGRIVSIATMTPEPPQKPGESMADYERRLPGYPSMGLAITVLEINGGLAETLGLKAGDIVPALAR